MATVLDPAKQWLSVTEVASVLEISRVHVYRLVDRGEIPSTKLGGVVRIPAAWLRTLEASVMEASVMPAAPVEE